MRKETMVLVAGLLLGSGSHLLAQGSAATADYPNKPVRFMVGFPPGGSTDIIARLIAPQLSQRLGQPIVLDNRAGAGGVIGVDQVAKAPPDGYTMGFGIAGALTSNVTLMPKLPYDPLKDLVPVSRVIINPMALVVKSSLGVNTVQEFIAAAKAQPGKFSYGTAGPGTVMNLAGERLKQMADIDITHVPYKGSAPAAVDLLGGQIQAMIADLATVKPHLDSGRLKALGVTSPQRSPVAPELPTIAESGVPGYEFSIWIALVMPAATPPEIVSRINSELKAVLNDPKVRGPLLAAKTEPAPTTPQEMRSIIQTEIAQYASIIKAAGIKLD